jgi:hypothetical protein
VPALRLARSGTPPIPGVLPRQYRAVSPAARKAVGCDRRRQRIERFCHLEFGWCFVALFCQDLEVVAIEGLRLIACIGVTDGFREGTEVTQWTWGLALRNWPVQPVLLTFVAAYSLSILLYIVASVSLAEVFLLCIGKSVDNSDCR